MYAVIQEQNSTALTCLVSTGRAAAAAAVAGGVMVRNVFLAHVRPLDTKHVALQRLLLTGSMNMTLSLVSSPVTRSAEQNVNMDRNLKRVESKPIVGQHPQ